MTGKVGPEAKRRGRNRALALVLPLASLLPARFHKVYVGKHRQKIVVVNYDLAGLLIINYFCRAVLAVIAW